MSHARRGPRRSGRAHPPEDDATLAAAAERLSRDVLELVRRELERARPEALASLRRAGLGTLTLTAAAVCGALAVLSAHEAALAALERSMPRRCAATALGAGYAVCGAGLAWWGRRQLHEVRTASQQALDQVREGPPFRE
ncbi:MULTISPECIES: phage holin family protein [Streptomyces]|uniref:Phage holin family protein n=1 Tax=Streptomyces luteosporeus TaxID=173856 RepID=A0ABN3U0U9_9ACTN